MTDPCGSEVEVKPAPDDLGAGFAAATGAQRSDNRLKETEDNARVVVQDGNRRIIACRDRSQWIIQRGDAEGRWTSISFCRWRDTLLRLCTGWSDDALAVIRALPSGIEQPDHEWPRCKCCGNWDMLPRDGLPRHMFCIAVRKARRDRQQDRA
jgi:hypothetical protein